MTPPRWLLLLLAVLASLAVGEGAGILTAMAHAGTVNAIWTGLVAFGATLFTMLSVISFLISQR